MADNVVLQANERKTKGKNEARRLRNEGYTPAVLYGDDGSTSLAVPLKVIDYTLSHYGDNALYDLNFGEGVQTARVVDVQRNPVTGRLVHVDFTPVNMTESIEVTVPLTVVGEARGVEEDEGVLQQVAYEIQVETLPGNIPQEIEVDVTELGMNENLALGDIQMPEGVTLISDPEDTAATVTPPTEITEEELEAAGIEEDESEEGIEEGDADEGGEEDSEGEDSTEEDGERE